MWRMRRPFCLFEKSGGRAHFRKCCSLLAAQRAVQVAGSSSFVIASSLCTVSTDVRGTARRSRLSYHPDDHTMLARSSFAAVTELATPDSCRGRVLLSGRVGGNSQANVTSHIAYLSSSEVFHVTGFALLWCGTPELCSRCRRTGSLCGSRRGPSLAARYVLAGDQTAPTPRRVVPTANES